MIHTAFDVMKEYMITGAELDGKYQFPVIPAAFYEPFDTIDFADSFKRSIKNHRELNVNFYIHDNAFERVYANPDRYLEHLRCFHSVCGLDYSIASGEQGMPFAMQIWNKYRNHALTYYLALNGVKMIPNISILSEDCWDWCFDGYTIGSNVACSTNGRMKSKASRIDFCNGFYEMCRRLQPNKVIIVGRLPKELKSEVPIINLKSRNQLMEERWGRK